MSLSSAMPFWPELPDHDKRSAYALHAQLLFTQWMQPDRFQYFQLLQLEDLLRFAAGFSTYYGPVLNFLENLPPRGLYPEHLSLIPIMNRDELRKNSQKIMIRRRLSNQGKSRMVRISKSNGPPIKIMVTGLIDAWSDALALRALDWNESDASMTCLRILRNTDRNLSGRNERWSILPWSGPLNVLAGNRPSHELFDELIRINPGCLQTEPRILEGLMDHAISTGYKPQNLRQISCRGESLDPELKSAFEKQCGVPVFHEYFLEEVGVIAHQCPATRGLHINSEYVYVEVLNDRDKPCAAGETGRVVVTSLQSFQTPLIRYDTGNLAEVGAPCECGRTLPVLNRITA